MPDLNPAMRRPDEPLVDACRRVAIDAVYQARDSGGTMHTAGAAAADAVLALLAPIDDHLVHIGRERFTVTHPLTERADGTMHLCALHQWLSEQGSPPAPPGRYRAIEHQPDAYSEDYRADPWELELLEDDRSGTTASGDDRG
jgi:hypothetical protein